MAETIWVCQTNAAHVFNEPTEDYYCPICPPLEGILLEVVGKREPVAAEPVIVKAPPPVTQDPDKREIGLSVLLMDASSSMTDPAFEGSPLTRMRLISNSAASG